MTHDLSPSESQHIGGRKMRQPMCEGLEVSILSPAGREGTFHV
jgi:hypothetical protein